MRRVLAFLVFVAAVAATVAAPTGSAVGAPKGQARTTVVAGGSFGDGLSAVRASLSMPRGIAVGPDGRIYIADFFHHQIRVVDHDGTIETLAGTYEGFAGDGGPPGDAQLNRPMGITFDSAGDLLFTDGANNRIRRVALPGGRISTVAGDGRRTYAGDGGSATAASIAFAGDVAMRDDGTLFIADTENYRVRKVGPNGTISTFAGDGTSVNDFDVDGLPADRVAMRPYALALDERGNLYVGDGLSCRVLKIDRGTKTVSKVAGAGCGYAGDGGPARDALLRTPTGLDVAPDGSVYIADADNKRVRVVGSDGTIRTIAGDGSGGCPADPSSATAVGLTFPYDVDVAPDGSVYLVVQDCHRAYRLKDGTLSPLAGNGTAYAGGSGDPATSINFREVRAVAEGPDGRPYFAESRGIWTVTPDGTAVLVAGGEPGDQDGAGPDARLKFVTGLAFDERGVLWIADGGAGKIKRLEEGVVTTVAGKPDSLERGDGPALDVRMTPLDLVVRSDGSVVFTEGFGRLRLLEDGMVTTIGGIDENRFLDPIGDGGPVAKALFREPWGLAEGPDGSLYVADRQHQRIRRVAPDGTISTVAGDGGEVSRGDGTLATLASFSTPEDVAIDAAGNLFVTDGKNAETFQPGGYVVRHVAPNGMVSRLAGTGVSGTGADGPSLESPLANPVGVALGADGLLVADGTTVRSIAPPGGRWPVPPRRVVCERFFVDTDGDAQAQYGVSFVYGPNMPWVDLLSADVKTDATSLTVTMRYLDLNERALVPPGPEIGTAWAWTYFFKGSGGYKYLAALSPSTNPPGQVVFEHGDSGLGRGSATKQVTRRGAATGTFDMAKDEVTITAPLSALGLAKGEVVLYHEATGGEMVDVGFSRFVNPDDTTFVSGFLPGTARSYSAGTRCPEDY